MSDTVKNVSDILIELEKQLKADTRTAGMKIVRMGQVNTDASKANTGWVGLYADGIDYGPHTLGMGFSNWDFELHFKLVVQAVDRANSANAHVRLEKHIKDVLDVILSDVTLNSLVDKLDRLTIDYATDETDKSTLHYEGALLSLQFTGRTN